MLQVRKSNERGFADHGWLKSFHTFSFANYHDPNFMGFGPLRVINEDRIEGGTGFGAHPHRDMEIISYVMEGALQHSDSMGNKAVIVPGEVQLMSAGSGVVHSEFNHLADQKTHFLQIWIMPSKKGLPPGYGQKSFAAALREKKMVLVVSPDGRDRSIEIGQNASIYIAKLAKGVSLDFPIEADRKIWVQLIKGAVSANGTELVAGDGLAATDERTLKLTANDESEFMLFDLGD